MASVRYEYIKLGRSVGTTGWADNVIIDSVGTGGNLPVTTTATAAAGRPTVPTIGKVGELYVRLTAIDGPVHVEKGIDPTVTLTNGLRLVQNVPEVIAVSPGDKLSFIGEV
jgi:hypothetical protein